MKIPVREPVLVAADSFRVRVRGGRAEVRGLERHLERFRWAAADAGLSLAGLNAFLAEARRAIAEFGEGFPRLELWVDADGSTRFEVALREPPPLGETLELRSHTGAASEHARRKGPNIARYSALNRGLGAETLLVGIDGLVREGATTSLVCWRGANDEAGFVIDAAERVPSVTEALLLSAVGRPPAGTDPGQPPGVESARPVGIDPAPAHRFEIGRETATVSELQRCELWAVNALHGIRPVTQLDGVALPAPTPERLEWFRAALDATWKPVAG